MQKTYTNCAFRAKQTLWCAALCVLTGFKGFSTHQSNISKYFSSDTEDVIHRGKKNLHSIMFTVLQDFKGLIFCLSS